MENEHNMLIFESPRAYKNIYTMYIYASGVYILTYPPYDSHCWADLCTRGQIHSLCLLCYLYIGFNLVCVYAELALYVLIMCDSIWYIWHLTYLLWLSICTATFIKHSGVCVQQQLEDALRH